MKRPAQSSKAVFAAAFLALLLTAIAGPAYGGKTPKFVYVVNGSSSTGDVIQTYNVTATAVCGNGDPCASTISITGSFTVDLTTGKAIGGTMTMTDPSDMNDSPLSLPFNLQGSFAPAPNEYLFFRKTGGTNPTSYVEIIFPFLVFPANYSGGPVCTMAPAAAGCDVVSGAEIGADDINPTLYSSLAACCAHAAIAEITAGSVTLASSSSGSASGGPGSVSGYSIDPATGALTPVPGSPFAAGSGLFRQVSLRCQSPLQQHFGLFRRRHDGRPDSGAWFALRRRDRPLCDGGGSSGQISLRGQSRFQ